MKDQLTNEKTSKAQILNRFLNQSMLLRSDNLQTALHIEKIKGKKFYIFDKKDIFKQIF